VKILLLLKNIYIRMNFIKKKTYSNGQFGPIPTDMEVD